MNVMELFRLDGKAALVTGGSRGLGFWMAEGLAEADADDTLCEFKCGAEVGYGILESVVIVA